MALECECCGVRSVERKSKGIGVYCDTCLQHWVWFEDIGRPGGGTFEEVQQRIEEDHERLRREARVT